MCLLSNQISGFFKSAISLFLYHFIIFKSGINPFRHGFYMKCNTELKCFSSICFNSLINLEKDFVTPLGNALERPSRPILFFFYAEPNSLKIGIGNEMIKPFKWTRSKTCMSFPNFLESLFSKDVCERLFLDCFLELVHCRKNGLNQL